MSSIYSCLRPDCSKLSLAICGPVLFGKVRGMHRFWHKEFYIGSESQMDLDENCIFCRIVAGTAPCYKVYEDDHVIAFLDIAPSSPFHTLLVPKKHARFFHDLPPEEAAHIYRAMPAVARAVLLSSQADGYNLVQNNGKAAGQEVFHVHVHVLPRFDKDKLVRYRPAKARIEEDTAREQVRIIKNHMPGSEFKGRKLDRSVSCV